MRAVCWCRLTIVLVIGHVLAMAVLDVEHALVVNVEAEVFKFRGALESWRRLSATHGWSVHIAKLRFQTPSRVACSMTAGILDIASTRATRDHLRGTTE